MEMWVSWAAFLLAGGAAAVYYTTDRKSAPRGRAQGRAQEEAAPAAAPGNGGGRNNRQREDGRGRRRADTGNTTQATNTAQAANTTTSGAEVTPTSGAQPTSRAKAKNNQSKTNQPKTNSEAAGPSASQSSSSGAGKDENEDKDWAERLAGLKKGTTLAAPARKEARSKTVKQTAANAEPQTSKSTATSIVDTDDFTPSSAEPTPSGKDVSDMLEASAPGPSILRVTESTKPAQAKKPQQKQEPVAQETKKQRQNRRKVEERKQQRDQDEKERRVLLEQQLRTARESRGEPAKNGLQPAKGPQSSAWAQGDVKEKVAAPSGGAQLLDTFEKDGNSTTSSNAPNSVASTATTGANFGELPAEEEQVRLAIEDSSWNTVPNKRSKKKTANSVGDSTGDENAGFSTKVEKKPVKESEPTPAVVPNGRGVEPIGMPSIYDNLSNPNDSEWSVV